ncbi:SpoIIE family protein phosphatase [Cytophagaceae bacterium DM2B3-1]|uniref:SpoIIE family protein phosphatase n=1 Tax=Xanthocytophaga flava TaxID=3048013 RepID=A0ABT7CDD2_9BACT|nr:GAF domain-containing SpoIIE family protein phosphatase [Xanthocytophaga flavus]MDJ1473438.1 SpoIIE family protein phosphatase [Xanthocytophaga flavus]MDJ1491648.1 SpoIIE family protein phosphatase [Xanthocytophaga flavus]
MLSRENIIRIVVSVNIVSWLLLLGLNLITLLQGYDKTTFGVPIAIRGLLLNLFLILVFFYFKARSEEERGSSFVDQLVRLLDVGWVLALISIVLRFADFFFDQFLHDRSAQMLLLFYHIHIGLVTLFLTQTFFVWKKFILYQRSKRLQLTWQIFEYALLASLFFNFFQLDSSDALFYVILIPLSLLGIITAFNLKWVAYLDVRDKWKAILLTFLIGLFCAYFFWNLSTYARDTEIVTNLIQSVYILALFVFVGGYSVLGCAVLLFNLPTSVVFEQKIEELLDFQRLTQTFQAKENETQVYETLLQSTSKASEADAAWLIVANENRQITNVLTKNIQKQQALATEKKIVKELKYTAQSPISETIRKGILDGIIDDMNYQSVLLVPLIFQDKLHGTLGLLKTQKDGFTTDNVELISTFARMTGVAIENFRLVSKVIENERYQESLNIARKVQQKLLPDHFADNKYFEISAFSQSGDEVGGDYYDIFQISDSRVILIIGDVSGKGTSAAFHMAQMKGIFHSLVELHPPPHRFLALANNALSRCLDKDQFITASVFMIDSEKGVIHHARGGHCLAIYYSNETQSSSLLQNKGMGLGLLRRPDYIKHVTTKTHTYQSGDWLILYTDGILEARNADGDEFGEQRLLSFTDTHTGLSTTHFIDTFWEYFRHFCGESEQQDDYTIVAVRFL